MGRTLRGGGFVDWRVRVGGGCSIRLIERPGLSLGPEDLARLVDDLRGVADRCSPAGQLRYGVLSGDPARLANALLAVAYGGARGEMIAFSAMVVLDVTLEGRPARVVHAGLAMVDPGHRSRGLCLALTAAPALLAFVRNRLAPLWFTNVTQVPAVVGVFGNALADVYPTPERRSGPPAAHAAIVAEVMKHHRAAFGVGEDADFDASTFVIRNAYTGGSDCLKKTYAECAAHRDVRFNSWLREALDYERGDDVIQVGRMALSHWGRLFLRLVPTRRRSSPAPRSPMRGRPAALAPQGGARL